MFGDDKEQFEYYGGGMHRCFLSNPIHLDWASPGLCKMVGYSSDELHDQLKDKYSMLVHPDDRDAFREFVYRLAAEEGEETAWYRLLHRDGTVIPVSDTMISKRLKDGNMWGFSVVTKVENLSSKQGGTAGEASIFESVEKADTAQVVYSYSDYPKILSISDAMLKLLGLSQREIEENRRSAVAIAEYTCIQSLEAIAHQAELDGADCTKRSVPVQNAYLRCVGGNYIEVASLVSCIEVGQEMDCLISCVPVPEKRMKRTEMQISEFIDYMTTAFDVVFCLDYESSSATYVGGKIGFGFRIPEGVPMHMPDAYNHWVDTYVIEEDRSAAKSLIMFDTALNHGESRRVQFSVLYDGISVRYDAMYLGLLGGAALLFRRMNEDYSRAEKDDYTCDYPGVFIRTFGYFDVFVDGKAIPFSNEKAKEYLAFLVDRRGGFVTSREAAVNLFESDDKNALARSRKAAMYMNRTLEEYGIGFIVENEAASRRLVLGKVRCDLFDYMSASDRKRSTLFCGSYMNDYSWAEMTKAELIFSRDAISRDVEK